MVAAPVGLIVERRLIEKLLRLDALTAESAQPIPDRSGIENRHLQRLLRAGVVRETAPERYYLSGRSLADYLQQRRLRRIFGLLFLAVVAALFFWLWR